MPNFVQSATSMFNAPWDWARNTLIPPIDRPQVQPTGLFQSRITRTPGGFGPMPDKDTVGLYTAGYDPSQIAVRAPQLNPQEQQQLAQQWGQINKGFITLPPGDINPIVMRHEQIHALQNNANLSPYNNQIASMIDPGLVDQIKNDPVYQREASHIGWPSTIADEGSAIQLTTMPHGSTTPDLHTAIMSHLNDSIQQKQLRQLSTPRGQSQK